MARPERFVVAHRSTPGTRRRWWSCAAARATAPETVLHAALTVRGAGMYRLEVCHEIDGFIADRLLQAVWREALWLVHHGVATAAEIDDAPREGPGPGWSPMGTFMIYRPGGRRRRHAAPHGQFGPALQLPWTKLTDVPDRRRAAGMLTPNRTIKPTAARSTSSRGSATTAWSRVLSGLRGAVVGAGVDVGATERRCQRVATAARRDPKAPRPAPLALHGRSSPPSGSTTTAT